MLQAASGACPPGNGPPGGPALGGVSAAALAKEAVYCAIGVGAWELHDYIDFSPWFRSALLLVRSRTLNPGHSE